jgi:hypothetical protein
MPWVHLIAGEAAALEAARRIDARDGITDTLPPELRTPLRGRRVPHLNRLSVHGFEEAVRRTGLHVSRRRLLPPGWRRHPRLATVIRPWSSRRPWREVLTSQAAYVLTGGAAAAGMARPRKS